MGKDEPTAVDPAVLTECFAIYSRVQSGMTRYLRDDADTYSPMMSKLREDKCHLEPVINGFLAIQRYLSLRGLDASLFSYTDRVLFMLIVVEQTSDSPEMLPFLHDPAADPLAAAFFQALSQPEFEWRDDNTKSITERMRDVVIAMEPHVDARKFYEFTAQPIQHVEAPIIPKDAIVVSDDTKTKTVH